MTNLPAATVIMGGWSSTCNNCGLQTVNFVEHDEVSGYGPRRPGCGIKFTHITSLYGACSHDGLEYVDIRGVE